MATSESDDFESADEEMNHNISTKRIIQSQQWSSPVAIDSESDDDTEFVPRPSYANVMYNKRTEKYYAGTDSTTAEKRLDKDISIKDTRNKRKKESITNADRTLHEVNEKVTSCDSPKEESTEVASNLEVKENLNKNEVELPVKTDVKMVNPSETITLELDSKPKDRKPQKLGAKKLGTKITSSDNAKDDASSIISTDKGSTSIKTEDTSLTEFLVTEELTESNMPEEMKSDKKFKEVFKPEGWEGLGKEIELPEELTEEKLQPILKKLSLTDQETDNSSKGWGWGGWDVTSFINSASAGVSTLTSHVTHGLTLLEESIVTPDEPTITEIEEENSTVAGDILFHKHQLLTIICCLIYNKCLKIVYHVLTLAH